MSGGTSVAGYAADSYGPLSPPSARTSASTPKRWSEPGGRCRAPDRYSNVRSRNDSYVVTALSNRSTSGRNSSASSFG